MKKLITFLLLLLAFAAPLRAGEVMAFRHYTTADGLASNQINTVYRDSKGILWIGTGAGLDRYDAYRFSHYSQEDGLPGLYVTRLHEDTKGQIWIHTTEGITCYSYTEDRFMSPEEGLRQVGIRASAPVYFGSSRDHAYFWVADDRVLSAYSTAQNRVLTFPITSAEVQSVSCVHTFLYYIDMEGALQRANLLTGLVDRLDVPQAYRSYMIPSVTRIMADEKGNLWFYTAMNRWVVHRSVDNAWKLFDLEAASGHSTAVTDMTADAAGNVWIASSHDGLFVIDKDLQIRHITHNAEQSFSLPGDRLSTIHIDKDDIVWVGISKLGLASYAPAAQAPLHFLIPGAGDILATCEGSDGLYLGTNGNGVWKADRYDGTFKPVPGAPRIVSCLVQDGEGNMWIGSWGSGAICLGPDGRRKAQYTTANGLLTNSVMNIRPASDGHVYIGQYQGVVQRLDPKDGSLFTLYENRAENVRDLSFVNDSTLVVAVFSGLVTLDPHTGKLKDGPQLPEGMNASVLFMDHANVLWIAGRRGVWFWNPFLNEVTPLKEADGRQVKAATGVTEDLYGRIWISTTRGMMAVDRNGIEPFIRHYGTREGLGLSEFNARSILTLKSGEVLAGTPLGISVLHPQRGYSNSFDAEIFLTSVDYAGEDHSEQSRVPQLQESEMVIKNAMLPLSLYFSCLDYVSPEAVTYQYRIKGFSDRWTTMSGNVVKFSVLPPGKYELRVRVCNDQHIWSPNEKSLTLIVRPPWYRSFPAYFLYLCTILGLVLWFLRLMMRRRELAADMERMNKEAEFYAGVSHELRTPLTLVINPLDEFLKRYPQYREGFLGTARNNAGHLKDLIDRMLPFKKAEEADDAGAQAPLEEAPGSFSDIRIPEKVNHLPGRTLLLVDDNAEFLDFLSTSLSASYQVFRAGDGFQALDILRENKVDLVISDVMMPNMDGMVLCRTIKTDVNTSHIPVILLTARGGEEYQLEGLRQGADDYVTKPFNMDILLSRIAKLIANGTDEPARVEVMPADQHFVKKAVKVVEEHMSNADFSVEDLAACLNISRGYLYRKITAMTGKSAIEFIRTIRMKRAQQLLAESQLQIAEVAYQLGYHSPKTFAKHFRAVFGMSPSEYIRSWKA